MTRALAWLSLALLLAPTAAHAYTVRRSPGGVPVRWSAATIELRVDPELGGDATALVARAAEAWRVVEGTPSFAVAGVTWKRPGYHGPAGENGVYLVRGQWEHGRALAVTITTAVEATGEILDTDVLVSDRDDLTSSEEPDGRGYDLRSVLTHELGHALGLGESEVEAATMFPRLSRGDTGPRTLDADDEAGVLTIYPGAAASIGAVPSAGCNAVSSGGAVPAIIVLGALGALALRRRRALAPLGLALLAGFPPAVATSPRSADLEALAALRGSSAVEVVRTEVAVRDGLFVTRVHAEDGRALEVPGGAQGGIVQIAGEIEPPRVGDEIVLAGSEWAFAEGARVWGGTLGTLEPIELAP